jgi:hypothetical protein
MRQKMIVVIAEVEATIVEAEATIVEGMVVIEY